MSAELPLWCLAFAGTVAALIIGAVLSTRWIAASPYGIDRELRRLGSKTAMSGDDEDALVTESVCVIGAGVSGLYTAYKLGRRCRVVVLEGSSAPGGHNRSCPVAGSETPVQYGCSGWTTSPLLTALVDELGLQRLKVNQSMAALVEGELELNHLSCANRCWCRWVHFARSFSIYQQLRMTLWMGIMHLLFYVFPLQNWSAAAVLPVGNAGIDDIFIPACGINVFIDRCDLSSCPYTYFVRYASLYLGRRFFCIKEGNHELIRRLHAKVAACCDMQFDCKVSRVLGEEGRFFVQLESGATAGPFNQVIMACQPHLIADMLPADARFKDHKACLHHFETVVAHSVVHTDTVAHVQAKDPNCELGVIYDRTLGDKPHHYLHVNPAKFYRIAGFPEDTFVTVSYDDARPVDVISPQLVSNSFRTVLSRLKVGSQQDLPGAIKKVYTQPCGIHFANAAFLGLMWHEDGLAMAQLAQEACLLSMRPSLSAKLEADDCSQSTSVGSSSDASNDKAAIPHASADAAV